MIFVLSWRLHTHLPRASQVMERPNGDVIMLEYLRILLGATPVILRDFFPPKIHSNYCYHVLI